MGETIDFPLNNKMFLQKAINSLENENFEEALKYIAKAYEIDQSMWVNYTYTSVLYNLDRPKEALEIAIEQKETYLKHERYRLLYTLLLVKNQLFLEAEVLVQDNLNSIHSQLQDEWEKIANELRVERDLVNMEIKISNNRTKSKLKMIGEYSRAEQNEIIRKAHLLDLKDLQEVAPQLFLSPYTPQLVKNAFLEILVKKGDKSSYTLSWLNQHKEVVPKDLLVFESNRIVSNIDEFLEDKLQELPSIAEIVKMEFLNDLLLLYPFIDEVITDVDYWLDNYISYFDVNNILEIDITPNTQEQVDSKKYIDYLDLIAQRHTEL